MDGKRAHNEMIKKTFSMIMGGLVLLPVVLLIVVYAVLQRAYDKIIAR